MKWRHLPRTHGGDASLHRTPRTLEGMGSDMAKRGSARLAKVLRYFSRATPCTTLYSSRHTNPAQADVQLRAGSAALGSAAYSRC